MISFIIPVLNEAPYLQNRLLALQEVRRRGHELVLVDGGSQDGGRELARPLVDCLLQSVPGRSAQMNAGAERAQGEYLVFLHLDTQLPEAADQLILSAMQSSDTGWGWFRVRLENPGWPYRLIAWSMNLRSRLTRVCTGDQTLFVGRELFRQIGGFPQLPLMEDVAISKLLRRLGRPVIIAQPVTTSSRRWEKYGVVNTVLLMWRLRLMYFFGVSPQRLAQIYYPDR